MGALIRAHDWSKTALGSSAGWPQSLKTSIAIMLRSGYPASVCWGHAMTTFYNDSYIPVMGKKHPHRLGWAGKEVWPEVWDQVGPRMDQVLNQGQQLFTRDLLFLIDRKGFIEETYFTVQRDNPNVGLFISRPMLHGGAYAVVLSRRISGPDGRFLGVVAGSIRFSYFHELFGRLSLGEQDTITVFRKDGLVIMRTPFDLDVIGRNLNYSPGIKRVLEEPTGSLSRPRSPDGVDRLYGWRCGTSPLVVLV